MRFFATIVFIFGFWSMGWAQIESSDTLKQKIVRPFDLGIYENTSLIRLIATPEKYDGKTIQVIGYLHLEFEGDAIYLIRKIMNME